MGKLTPMMAQYRQIKEQHKDCILMFRLGDFYEMFFDDALTASKILQITLTARNKGTEQKAPMCGVPYHAVDNYLAKLTKAGKKVAICDQITAPNGQGIVERKVVRVVTPGTTFDDNILEKKVNNYVASIIAVKDGFAFSFADVTTGDFKVTEINGVKDLEAEFMRVMPAECICEENLTSQIKTLFKNRCCVFPFEHCGDPKEELQDQFGLKSLKPFGMEGRTLAIAAAAMLLKYLKETQKTELEHIQKISFYKLSQFMPLDESLIRNLELFHTNRDGKKEGSLIWILDHSITPMGGRMLRNWLLNPLIDAGAIKERLTKVELFTKNSMLLRELRELLSGIYDIERLLSRLSLGTGNARDLLAMKESLKIMPDLQKLLSKDLKDLEVEVLPELVSLIETAIVDEPPAITREGGMIKEGFNKELDELRGISREGKSFIKTLQEDEIKRTGISSLKVKFNKVFGYYIEISRANLSAVPEDYIRKQTLVNAERFITPELKEYEEKILSAEEKTKEIEYEVFYEVRIAVVKELVKIQRIAKVVAKLDVLTNLAFIAVQNRYCKPEINESGIEIIAGRHPVVERVDLTQDFIPNDCSLNENRSFLLVTGPNMGGKSTYLRQVALTVLMAQIGSFVPARSAKIGLVDRIFTRVGASDNLAGGESTFMVEMTETAYILNNATWRSLIILDEIGRGTSTYDGVSIAWAITEFVHDKIAAKTVFATHYHELIELADRLKNAVNLSVAVRENQEEGVVFLYKVIEGGIDKSYGIEVAKLAGLPTTVISRARGVLNELESRHIKKSGINPDQRELFTDKKSRQHQGLTDEIQRLDINELTPMEALKKLSEMKEKLN